MDSNNLNHVQKFYTAWSQENLTFLSSKDMSLLNLSNESRNFLLNTGLPKEVFSLKMSFELNKIDIYNSTFDCISNVNLNSIEEMYQIGYSGMFGNGIAIQQSNESIYIVFSYGCSNNEPIERSTYFNIGLIWLDCFC